MNKMANDLGPGSLTLIEPRLIARRKLNLKRNSKNNLKPMEIEEIYRRLSNLDKKGLRMDESDSLEVYGLYQAGMSKSEIARQFNRHRSTISKALDKIVEQYDGFELRETKLIPRDESGRFVSTSKFLDAITSENKYAEIPKMLGQDVGKLEGAMTAEDYELQGPLQVGEYGSSRLTAPAFKPRLVYSGITIDPKERRTNRDRLRTRGRIVKLASVVAVAASMIVSTAVNFVSGERHYGFPDNSQRTAAIPVSPYIEAMRSSKGRYVPSSFLPNPALASANVNAKQSPSPDY
ncbi:helix-turn-helix domain-containing protein [Candidatus Pacearchaeota archaeon]|nr:helix-turn-helix domain-containing protein [Candidatus Pacearchaeota archaeon]